MNMPSNIVAYEWPLDETKQVAFIAGDDQIHEMVTGQKGRWRDDAISELAGAPALALEMAIMTGYAWSDGRTKQIAYVSPVDGNGHIHELMVGVMGMWAHSDLTQLTGAPLAEGSALVGYAWESGGTRQVLYGSGDGHIRELSAGKSGSWSHRDLTQLTGAPPAEGSALAGYAWEAGGTRQVVYIGSDRHIYELAADGSGTWTYTDLLQLTGTPLVEGSALAGYSWETGGSKQVVYVGSDRHIYELASSSGGTWSHTDLTRLTDAPELV